MRLKPHTLPANDAAAFVQRSISTAPSRFRTIVTLEAPADEITRRISPQWGTIRPLDARRCQYVTADDDLHWLALRIAMLGVDFELDEPPALVEHLRALALRIQRATG